MSFPNANTYILAGVGDDIGDLADWIITGAPYGAVAAINIGPITYTPGTNTVTVYTDVVVSGPDDALIAARIGLWVAPAAPPATVGFSDQILAGTIADNDILQYDLATDTWQNQTLTGAGVAPSGHTHVAADITDFATAVPAAVPSATIGVEGKAELATQAEVDAGTDAVRIVTADTLNSATTVSHPGHTHVIANITDLGQATDTVLGLVERATQLEVNDGTDTIRHITPATLSQYIGGFPGLQAPNIQQSEISAEISTGNTQTPGPLVNAMNFQTATVASGNYVWLCSWLGRTNNNGGHVYCQFTIDSGSILWQQDESSGGTTVQAALPCVGFGFITFSDIALVAVDDVGNTITVAGDLSVEFASGVTFEIGNSNFDGNYTSTGAVFGGVNTVISVAAIAGGSVLPADVTGKSHSLDILFARSDTAPGGGGSPICAVRNRHVMLWRVA
jgi:hypothetical protein